METLKITDEMVGKRVDQVFMSVTEYSRNQIQTMIEKGTILVNEKPTKNGYRIKKTDTICYGEFEKPELKAIPEKMDLDIVYEDEDVIVVNKANGVVVHPAVGNPSGTLVNGLLYHSKQLSDVNGEFRPGIVHRIDAYTTGLLMVAKNNKTHELLSKQLEEKTTKRKYIALVWGVIQEDSATIKAPIGRDSKDRKKMAVTSINSKPAITHIRVLKRYKEATLIECELETGRTHQIRVHLNYIGHPVINDPVYGKRKLIDQTGQCLHAALLGFIHPTTQKYMEFTATIPKEMEDIISQFEND